MFQGNRSGQQYALGRGVLQNTFRTAQRTGIRQGFSMLSPEWEENSLQDYKDTLKSDDVRCKLDKEGITVIEFAITEVVQTQQVKCSGIEAD